MEISPAVGCTGGRGRTSLPSANKISHRALHNTAVSSTCLSRGWEGQSRGGSMRARTSASPTPVPCELHPSPTGSAFSSVRSAEGAQGGSGRLSEPRTCTAPCPGSLVQEETGARTPTGVCRSPFHCPNKRTRLRGEAAQSSQAGGTRRNECASAWCRCYQRPCCQTGVIQASTGARPESQVRHTGPGGAW